MFHKIIRKNYKNRGGVIKILLLCLSYYDLNQHAPYDYLPYYIHIS